MTVTEFYDADAFDLDLVTSNLEEVDRDALERMRLMMWAALAPYSKTQRSPEELLQFSWEKHEKDEAPPITTREQFDKAFEQFAKRK